MTNLRLLLRRTVQRFEKAGIADPRIEAELVWMTALEEDRPHLYVASETIPTEEQAAHADDMIARRLRHEPAAYIMGKREFYGVELVVAPGVLVPRPDTETLVEEALRLLIEYEHPIVADVGCGSGAISVALATHLPGATIYATDISDVALAITRANVERAALDERIKVLKGDLLEAVPKLATLVAANLPYVRSADIPTLDPEIRMFEPKEALDGGDDGLDLVRRLLDQTAAHVTSGGWVLFELDPRQMESASGYASQVLPGCEVRRVTDLARRERVLVVRVP